MRDGFEWEVVGVSLAMLAVERNYGVAENNIDKERY